MDIEKLKQICNRSVRSAGPRYTPGVDENAPSLEIKVLDKAFEGLLCSQLFRDAIDKLANNLSDAHDRAGSHLRVPPRQFRRPSALIDGLKTLAAMAPGAGGPLVTRLKRASTTAADTAGRLSRSLHDAREERHENLRKEAELKGVEPIYEADAEVRRISDQQSHLRNYQGTLEDIHEFLESQGCRMQHINCALLLGEWGTGKTHFLADLAKRSLEQGVPVLFLLAKDFSTQPDLCSALVRHIAFNGNPAELGDRLNVLGEAHGTRALIIIDGINESDHEAWRSELRQLVQMVKGKRHVGLVLSCRQPFEHLVISDRDRRLFVDLSHPGFTDIEFDAQTEFFRFYDVPLPEVPLLAEEFSRPLTLKIMCEAFKELPKKAQRKGFAGVASGQRGMTFVLEKFINSRGKGVEEELGLPNKYCWSLIKGDGRIQPSQLSGIAPFMAKHIQEAVPKDICLDIFTARAAIANKKIAGRLYRQMIAEGILVEDVVWHAAEEGGPITVVRLPYQRFGDHIVARHLLEKYLDIKDEHSIRKSFYKSAQLGRLFVFDSPHYARYEMPGWVEALIVEFPERVRKRLPTDERELFFYLPKQRRHLGAYFEPFVGGLFWRNPASISSQTDRLVGALLWGPNEYVRSRVLEALIAVATKADHPYRGARLFLNLENLEMTRRDLAWSEFLRERMWGSSVERLVSWFEQGIPDRLSENSALNLINILALLLTVPDRVLRDRATKVLVLLGEKFPRALFRHTERCLSFSDPYVPERMLAACYGVAMSKWAVRGANEFHAALPGFARVLVREIFAPGGCRLTHHILMRDYALGVIELARKVYPGCIAPKNVRYIRRPYPGIPDPFPALALISEAEHKEAEHAIQMDFGNYTIGHIVSGRANYQMEHPGYQEIRKKIEWRISNLGYRRKLFANIDEEIGRDSFRREQRGQERVDRYGKKYSWIAYFEMYGLLDAQGNLPDYRQNQRTSDCDLDPSFPGRPPVWEPALPDLFSKSPKNEIEWIRSGPTPKYTHLLELGPKDEQGGPWVLLDGYVSETDLKTKRQAFSFLRGLIVESSEISELEKRLKGVDHPGSGLPDPGEDHYTFAGEVPWSSRFAAELRTASGRLHAVRAEAFAATKQQLRRKRLKRAWKYVLAALDAARPQNFFEDIAGEVAEITTEGFDELLAIVDKANALIPEQDKITRFDLLYQIPSETEIHAGYQMVQDWEPVPGIPVEATSWYHGWESYHSRLNDFSGFRFPSPGICESLGLVATNRSIELLDGAGRQASRYRDIKTDELRFNLLYLRKDLLNKYLIQKRAQLVWIVWGEREFHYDIMGQMIDQPEASEVFQSYAHIHKRLVRYRL